MLRFAIPSKGNGYDGAVRLLESLGLGISRANARQYTARMRGLPDTEVLLHRPEDIVDKVAYGSIDIGITGLDIVHENREDDENLLIIYEDLGFWGVDLVFAAPQAWIDVSSWQDLADLSIELQGQGRPLRIATKYPNLVRRFCYCHGINVFRLIPSAGATEAAPGLGYADIIADITETGTALRDNQLKVVGGVILHSQACLVGSKRSLKHHAGRLELVRQVLELMEARQNGHKLYSLTANVPGDLVEAVGQQVMRLPELAGLQGPTIAPVWNKHAPGADEAASAASEGAGWYEIHVIVPQKALLPATDHLRSIGASSVSAIPVQYTFYAESSVYRRLLEMLNEAG
ncbi:MAG: ATP phosphoribosyltransferase [Chloroflexaceae bacterium]|nr:ATP phosphoribosyltransferase [Chloroflexaceae bacterium]